MKRWSSTSDCDPEAYEDDIGDYVLWEDVEPLLADNNLKAARLAEAELRIQELERRLDEH